MHKRDITYTNLDGEEVTETFYFHLNKAEAMKVQASLFGASGLELERAVRRQEFEVPIEKVLDLIAMSYGEKSADGRVFRKSPEITADFTQTDAYGELVETLVTDQDELVKFFTGIMPKDYAPSIKEAFDSEAAKQAAAAATHRAVQTTADVTTMPPPLPPQGV